MQTNLDLPNRPPKPPNTNIGSKMQTFKVVANFDLGHPVVWEQGPLLQNRSDYHF